MLINKYKKIEKNSLIVQISFNMAVVVHNNMSVRNYNNGELGWWQRCSLESKILEEGKTLTKIFYILNGAYGTQNRDIPSNLAGFMNFWMDVRCYRKLRIIRELIQLYQRNLNPDSIHDIRSQVQELITFWKFVAMRTNGAVPNDLTLRQAIDNFKRMENLAINPRLGNYNNFNGQSWVQYYDHLITRYQNLTDICAQKSEAYRQDWIRYFARLFNPVSWFNFVANGFRTHQTTSNTYMDFVDRSLAPREHVINIRIHDIQTADEAFDDLLRVIDTEVTVINTDANHNNPISVQACDQFKRECDRLMAIIRDSIGTISNALIADNAGANGVLAR